MNEHNQNNQYYDWYRNKHWEYPQTLYNYNYEERLPDINYNDIKHSFNKIGLGLVVMLAVAYILILVISGIVEGLFPNYIATSSWAEWTILFVAEYFIAMPLAVLIMYKLPKGNVNCISKVTFKKAITVVFINFFVLYSCSIIGTILAMIGAIFSTGYNDVGTVDNIVNQLYKNNIVVRVLGLIIIAPVCEELVFRKVIIDRTSQYGEKLSIIFSAIIFGCMHGNITQFCYTFGLGIVSGYVYLRTRKIHWSMMIHALVNFMGGFVAPKVLIGINYIGIINESVTEQEILEIIGSKEFFMALAFIAFIFIMWLIGLILFISNFKNIKLYKSEIEISKDMIFKNVYLNPWIIVFLIISLISIILTL